MDSGFGRGGAVSPPGEGWPGRGGGGLKARHHRQPPHHRKRAPLPRDPLLRGGGESPGPCSDAHSPSEPRHLSFPTCAREMATTSLPGSPCSLALSPAPYLGSSLQTPVCLPEQYSTVSVRRAGGAGGGGLRTAQGGGAGGCCIRQAWAGARFVPTHGAVVEADGLSPPDSSRESVAPPSATRGLPGPHFKAGN